jgi:Tfp pilus assembly protein FimT
MNTMPSLSDDERGITLVELVIYMALAAVFLIIVSAIFITGWLSQAATADRDAATGSAGVVTASLQQSVRNASALNPQPGSGNALVAVVATGASGWECRAWVRLDNGDLRYTTSHSRIDVSGAADYSSGSGWSTLASGITLPPQDVSVPDGPRRPMFTVATPASVTYAFAIAKSQESVPVTGAVSAQAVIPGGGPCW